MPQFSIIIPTFNHGTLIGSAIESVLQQTEQDWELVVIGDGSSPETAETVQAYAKKDPRIQYLQKNKGPRNGEIYRDEVIRKYVTGKYICYLSDDDLYFPDHLAQLKKALQTEANFVHTVGLDINPQGEYTFFPADLNRAYFVQLLLAGENRIPLSNAAHRRDLYDHLPYGWRTTPKGIPTDLYMWQQFLRCPQTKPTTIFTPTVLHLASPERKNWSQQKRLQELQHWSKRLKQPEKLREEMRQTMFQTLAAHEELVMHRSPIMEQLRQIFDSKIGWLVKGYFGLKKFFLRK